MKETELKIKTLGEEVLRNGVKPVEKITESHRKMLSQMARLMYSIDGVGLAAPQVGINESMIVVDPRDGTGLYKLVNPKIIKKEGQQDSEEGCLSVPGVGVKVKRAKRVVLEAQDETGKNLIIEAEGFLANIFQHELDHLNGKLIVDYLPKGQKNESNPKKK